ncbi:16442_t:CDS:2, partial [Gigaspora rosea]
AVCNILGVEGVTAITISGCNPLRKICAQAVSERPELEQEPPASTELIDQFGLQGYPKHWVIGALEVTEPKFGGHRVPADCGICPRWAMFTSKDKLQKACFRLPITKSFYNLAGNAYLQEEGASEDLCGYVEITNNKKDTYNLEELQEHQYWQLLQFLKQNTDLFIWEEKNLERTNLIKHHISTGNALPIKHILIDTPQQRKKFLKLK